MRLTEAILGGAMSVEHRNESHKQCYKHRHFVGVQISPADLSFSPRPPPRKREKCGVGSVGSATEASVATLSGRRCLVVVVVVGVFFFFGCRRAVLEHCAL